MKKLTAILVLALASANANAFYIDNKAPYKNGSPWTVDPDRLKGAFSIMEGEEIGATLDKVRVSGHLMDPTDQTTQPWGMAVPENEQPRMNMSKGFTTTAAWNLKKGISHYDGMTCVLRYFDGVVFEKPFGKWKGDLVCISLSDP